MFAIRSISAFIPAVALAVLALVPAQPARGGQLFPDPCTAGIVSFVSSPGSRESADLNLDGVLDLVVFSYDKPYFNVLLGRGDGSFAVSRFDHSGYALGLALADLDDDGFADIVTSRRSQDQIAIYLGNGDGTFGPPLDIPAPGPLYDGSSFHVADLNGDGHLDLIAGIPGEHWTYLGNGDGTFEPPTLLHDASAICALGQFDSEDPVDLACAQRDQVCTYRGDGDGGFLHDSEVDCTAVSAHRIAAGNLDGQGLDEIVVVAHNTGRATVLTRASDLKWALPVDHPLANSIAGDIALRDVDADGDLDCVAAHRNQRVLSTLINDGSGGLGPVTAVPIAYPPGMVEVEDFDGDEVPDVQVIALYNAVVQFLQGRGDGTFRGSEILRLDGDRLMASGDYDGNGTPDFASGNGFPATELTSFFNDGSGVFDSTAPIPVTAAVVAAVTADFDNNGTADLLLAHDDAAPSPGTLLAGQGDGTFVMHGPVMFAVPVVSTLGQGLVTSLLNEDAYPDVVALAPTALQILLGSPDGGLAPQTILQLPDPAGQVVVADVDRDGPKDLVVNLADRVAVYRGDGLGGFGAPIFSSTAVSWPGSIAVLELGRDDRPDLIVSRTGSSSDFSRGLQIMQGNGDGTFSAVEILTTGAPVSRFVVGDYDGDGRDDVAIVKTAPGFEIGLNRGDGTLEPGGEYCGPPMVSGDLNGDGRADLLWGTGRSLNIAPLIFGFGEDRDRMEWPPVDQALAYDMYRGFASDLAAGLGYGACITSLDTDPTDTEFRDTEVPPQGRAYFYLRAVLLPDGGPVLGTASDGTPRIPADVCP